MQVVNKKVSELIPYANNPRKNEDAVEYVAESIRQFGFKIPIVIDKDNVVVCGHTRLLACEELGIEEVPCVVADDLSKKQIKAFRLADNKVAEKSTWDYAALDIELKELTDIDLVSLGFEFDEEEEPEKENERLRTDNAYNLQEVDIERVEGFYQMPILEPEHYTPENLIGFNYALTAKEKNVGVHFYLDDYQFERVWTSPDKYIELLSNFDCVFTPDFSLYIDMPIAMQIWNTYRSRLIGQMMQDNGLTVIPTVSWAGKDSYDFCFDGLQSVAPSRSAL